MCWSSIGFAVATIAGDRLRKDKLAGIHNTIDKSKFNRTGFPHDKESRRDAQFKFFGYKPKRFISVYARKPRVRVKVKEKQANSDRFIRESTGLDAALQSGIHRYGLDYIRSAQFAGQQAAQAQMVGMNMAAQAQTNAYNQMQLGGFCGGGGLGILGLGQASMGNMRGGL